MPTEQTQEETSTQEQTRVSVDVEAAENEAIAKAMGQVQSLVDGIAKASGVDEPQESTESKDSEEDAEEAVEKGSPRSMFKAALKAAGIKGPAFEKAMGDFDKSFKPEVSKSDETPEAPTVNVDDVVEATADAIAKAKAFTPGRIAKLQEAFDTLQKLMMEVIPAGSSPRTKAPTVTGHGNTSAARQQASGSSVQKGTDDVIAALAKSVKGLSEAVSSQSEEVKKAIGDLSGRLEKVESARPTSQSESDGGTAEAVTKSSELWSGVL